MKSENAKFLVRFVLALLGLAAFVGLMLVCNGCKSFYEHTGSSTEVGEVFAPVKVTEPTSSWNVELIFNLTGARVWTAKDSRVTTHYRNTYTNNYMFGMVERNGVQDFDVEVEPLATDDPSEANASTEEANSTPATQVADE